MTREERDRLIKTRIRMKKGEHVSKEDIQFLCEMHEKFPEEYPGTEEINDLVFPSMNPLFEPSGKSWNWDTKKYE